jgi:hypothetical protein
MVPRGRLADAAGVKHSQNLISLPMINIHWGETDYDAFFIATG